MIDIKIIKTAYKTRSNNTPSGYGTGYLGTIGLGNTNSGSSNNTSPAYILPAASDTRLGGIILGSTLTMAEDSYVVDVDLSSYFTTDDSGMHFERPIFASNGVFDSLTVNGSFKASEYVVDKIRATNGNLMVTDSAVIKQISFGSEARTNILMAFENGVQPFKRGDILLHQKLDGYSVTATRYVVINPLMCVCKREDGGEMTKENIPQVGDSLIRVSGSYIALKGSEGVLEVASDEQVVTRLGKLSNGEYGLESGNAYITGDITARQYSMKPTVLSIYDDGDNVKATKDGVEIPIVDNIVVMVEIDTNRLVVDDKSTNLNGSIIYFTNLDSVHDGSSVRIEYHNGTAYDKTFWVADGTYEPTFIATTNGQVGGFDVDKNAFSVFEMEHSEMMKEYWTKQLGWDIYKHSGLFLTSTTVIKNGAIYASDEARDMITRGKAYSIR
jgi:hypothetical protein